MGVGVGVGAGAGVVTVSVVAGVDVPPLLRVIVVVTILGPC